MSTGGHHPSVGSSQGIVSRGPSAPTGIDSTSLKLPLSGSCDASSPGALDFWRAYPAAVEVFDARPDPWDTVHFELDIAQLPHNDAI
jgi:hypothetical protein